MAVLQVAALCCLLAIAQAQTTNMGADNMGATNMGATNMGATNVGATNNARTPPVNTMPSQGTGSSEFFMMPGQGRWYTSDLLS